MYASPRYPTDRAEAEAFVSTQRHGTLIATSSLGYPQVSILPFVKHGDLIELHCVQADPTFEAVSANPHVTFFVSDFLAFSPHSWIDPVDAGRATLNFRAVAYECDARVSTDPGHVAEALRRLMATYEPGEQYAPLLDAEPYAARLRRLAALRLTIVRMHAKFKVGPASPPIDARERTVRGLRERNWPGDGRAADVIEATIKEPTR
jgi:transcriptional regulator